VVQTSMELANEVRAARLSAGLSQAALARAARVAQATVSRIERAELRSFDLDALARIFAVLGMRLSMRAYREGSAVRDRAHLALIGRFLNVLPSAWSASREVPVAGGGDRRAWDVRLHGPATIGVEAETRLHDMQDLQRRVELKRRDGRVDRVILLVAATRHNVLVLREHGAALRSTFELDTRPVLRALRRGRDPGGNGIVVL
jgi:transcriptional regulator with XRE-family HTH domain